MDWLRVLDALRRQALTTAYYDKALREHIYTPDTTFYPGAEDGEVLTDTRGRGTFQRRLEGFSPFIQRVLQTIPTDKEVDNVGMNWFFFLGFLIGALIRTLTPAIRKWYTSQDTFTWNPYYTNTFLDASVIAFLVTIFNYFIEATPIPEEHDVGVFLSAIGVGALAEASIIEVGKWFGFPKEP